MTDPTPFGSWPSPIDAAAVARADGRPEWPAVAGEDLWWCEPRPAEGGRVALVRRRGDSPPETVLPPPWNVRSRIHEYGGLPWLLTPAGAVFAEFTDQRLYLLREGAEPVPLTAAPVVAAGDRYAEPLLAPDGDAIWCVRERLRGGGPTDVERALVAVPLDGSAAEDDGAVRVLARSHHFLTCPQLSPDGRRLAWIGWDHPQMPWDHTALCVAELGPDGPGEPRVVLGERDVAVVQCAWLDPTSLLVVSDPDGWWNLHRVDVTTGASTPLLAREEDFGGPLWKLGLRWCLPLADGRIVAVHGFGRLTPGVLDPSTGAWTELDTPFTEWAGLLAADERRLLGVAGSPSEPWQPVEVDLATGASRAHPRVVGADVPAAYLPEPEHRTFAGVAGRDVHAVVHPPRNPDVVSPGGPAPWVLFVHGGPTSRYATVRDLEIAYLTSRGLGVAEVDYGGTTGYGRAYRERLRESWGVVDVEDSIAVARGLVEAGLADPDRLAIRGGSAGGFTSAAALATSEVFACAAISYPILDLAGWRTGETHDFESHYLESLVGPWPATRERYDARSPVNLTAGWTAPYLLMQGLEDEICPPVQCERLLDRLTGVPHAYLTFEGEQHGFRREPTLIASTEAELSLYAQVFGFTTDVPAIELAR